MHHHFVMRLYGTVGQVLVEGGLPVAAQRYFFIDQFAAQGTE